MGFSTKQKAKQMLEKNFITDKDYKLLLNHRLSKQKTRVEVIIKKRLC